MSSTNRVRRPQIAEPTPGLAQALDLVASIVLRVLADASSTAQPSTASRSAA